MDRLLRPSQKNSRPKDFAKDPMILSDDAIVNVTHAEHVSGYAIKVRFSDGAERVIDFESFLKQSTNPHIANTSRSKNSPVSKSGMEISSGTTTISATRFASARSLATFNTHLLRAFPEG